MKTGLSMPTGRRRSLLQLMKRAQSDSAQRSAVPASSRTEAWPVVQPLPGSAMTSRVPLRLRRNCLEISF